MTIARSIGAFLATGALALTSAVTTSAPASAARPTAEDLGRVSLAQVLAADEGFDGNRRDFDVLERALVEVLEARPDSRLAVLTRGGRLATAFLPTDLAFQRLVRDLTGEAPATERATVKAVRSLGVDTVKTVLLYHVVPGTVLTSEKVLAARGTRVGTAAGDSFRVTVRNGAVLLGDRDPDAANPMATVLDINRGNRQVGHAIDRVLRPVDL